MASYYPEEVIRRVREASDIVNVISDYVTLTRKGGNYFGLCPFHGEKTPSFSVNGREQYFHCFGCGVGGNVITFVMKMENLTFPEALKMLADRAKIDLPEAELSPEEKKRIYHRERMLEAARETARFYWWQLNKTPAGKPALQYLFNRKVTEEFQKKFGLGYSPVSRSALTKYLMEKKGFSAEELLDAGILSGKEGNTYDRFFNRLMFPIFDVQGRPIAFGGRVMGQGEPKYLNSPDSQLFNKRYHLYGLHLAKKTRRNYLLMVEGYMDVLSLHQAGFDNAVASLGTALTKEQAILMKRYTDQVILCYDSDAAGTNAARRAIPILEDASLNVKVIQVPVAKDPDEYIKENGPEGFEKVIEQAMDPVDFEMVVLQKANGEKVEGQIQTLHQMAERLAQIQSDMDRELHIRDVAAKMKVSEQNLKKEVDEIRSSSGLLEERGERRNRELKVRRIMAQRGDAQSTVLAALIRYPQVYPAVRAYVNMQDFPENDAFHHEAARYVLSCLDKEERPTLADLASCFTSVEDQEAAIRLEDYEIPEDKNDLAKFLTQSIRSMKQKQIDVELAESQDDENALLLSVRKVKDLGKINVQL